MSPGTSGSRDALGVMDDPPSSLMQSGAVECDLLRSPRGPACQMAADSCSPRLF